MINTTSELKQFLVNAKVSTYAAQGDAASATPLLMDSKQLEYSEGVYFYRDIYVGMHSFSGQEIVYRSEKAVWSMSYSGGLLNQQTSLQEMQRIYGFLRSALLRVPEWMPVRGPENYFDDALLYTCECIGGVENFSGVERISHSSIRLYELHFSGGSVI